MSEADSAALLLPSFHMRNGAEEPTEFGYFLLRKMSDCDPALSQSEVARRSGIGQATISRWIYKPHKPEPEKLRRLAPVIGVSYEDLMAVAGYGQPSQDIAEALQQLRPDVDPLAAELSAMLDENSPLPHDERELLRQMVNRLIDPHRRAMRPRRPS